MATSQAELRSDLVTRIEAQATAITGVAGDLAAATANIKVWDRDQA